MVLTSKCQMPNLDTGMEDCTCGGALVYYILYRYAAFWLWCFSVLFVIMSMSILTEAKASIRWCGTWSTRHGLRKKGKNRKHGNQSARIKIKIILYEFNLLPHCLSYRSRMYFPNTWLVFSVQGFLYRNLSTLCLRSTIDTLSVQ